MPPVPSEIPDDVIHMYQEQLAQKDAQIAALTALLHDSNTLLAQQQRIWESFLASNDKQPNAAAEVFPPHTQHDSATRGSTRFSAPISEPETSVSQTQAPEVSAPPTFIQSSAMAEHRLNVSGMQAPGIHTDYDPLSHVVLTPLEPHEAGTSREDEAGLAPPVRQDKSAERTNAPIPIAYFGSPVAGFARNLKEAAASRDAALLSDTEDTDDADRTAVADGRLASRISNSAESPGNRPWRQPLVGTLAAAAVVIVVGLLWRVLPGIVSNKRNSLQAINKPDPFVQKLPTESSLSSKTVSPAAPVQHAEENGPPRVAAQPLAGSTLPPIASKSETAATPGQEQSEPKPALHSHSSASLNASLIQAVTQADLRRVQTLVAQGADVNARNVHASSVLAMAARQGYNLIAGHLLSKGADINAANDKGWTALMLAVNYDHTKIVQALLQRGARTDLTNSQGTTALMLAAQNGNREIVRLLLAAGAPAMIKNSEGNTAKDLASRNGHKAIAVMLTTATSVAR